MPSKKKKYNARFPAGRIKRIMQSDEEIGKVAQAVPVIISRTLELFVESLLTKALKITNSRNAKTLSPSHMKQCIMAESRFDFLRELVKTIPDISVADESAIDNDSSPEHTIDPDIPYDLSMPSTSINRNSLKTTATETSNLRNGGGDDNENQTINNNDTTPTTTTTPTYSNSTTALSIDENPQSYMKRQLNLINRLRQRLETQTDSTITTSITNVSSNNTANNNINKNRIEISVPSSVIRHTSSELAATAITSDDPTNELIQIKYNDNYSPAEATPQLAIDYTKQNKLSTTNYSIKKSSNQNLNKNHENKLITTKTTSMDNGKLEKDNDKEKEKNQISKNIIRPKSKQIAIPAPIVHIDFCNKPVVKIDYSNLTPVITDINEDFKRGGNQSSPNIVTSTTTSTTILLSSSSSSTLTSVSSTKFSSPVINIDLSNMVPTPNSTNQPVVNVCGSSLKKSANQPNSTAILALNKNKNSFLELDEDYDNI